MDEASIKEGLWLSFYKIFMNFPQLHVLLFELVPFVFEPKVHNIR